MADLDEAGKDALVEQFQTITEHTSTEQCRQLLRMNGWNLQQAISHHFAFAEANESLATSSASPPGGPSRGGGGEVDDHSDMTDSTDDSVFENNDSGTGGSNDGEGTSAGDGHADGLRGRGGAGQERRPRSLIIPFDRLPWTMKWMIRVLRVFETVASFVFPGFLGNLILPRLRLALTECESTDTGAFLARFHYDYPPPHPPFFAGSFVQALQRSVATEKLLLCYLHSGQHYNTPAFCREVLCDGALMRDIAEDFVLWGGDVMHSEGFQVQSAWGICDYPALIVFDKRGTQARVVRKAEGLEACRKIRGSLAAVVEERKVRRLSEQLDRQERELERQMREEQEQAYRQAEIEEAVREREEAEKAEQEALEAEEAQRRAEMEEAERARAAAEEAERTRLAEEERQRELEAKRARVGEEPSPGTEGVTSIAIRTSGGRLVRRFLASDTLGVVKDYVDLQAESEAPSAYHFVTTHPRQVFEDMEQTLGDAGLCPKAMLMIEEDDEA